MAGVAVRALLALALAVGLQGQGIGRFSVRSYDATHGLNAPFPHTLVQDAQGMIWAGAGEGLFKGDGRRFEQVPVPGGEILARCLVVDPDNTLWMATAAGLFRLPSGGARVEAVTSGLPRAGILGLARDAEGRHWLVADGGPYVEVAPLQFAPAPGWPSDQKAVGLVSGGEHMRVLTASSILTWDRRSRWRVTPGPPLPLGDRSRLAAMDGDGQLWVGSMRGLWRRTASGWVDLHSRTLSRLVTSLICDRTGDLWLTGRFGIVKARGDRWEPLPPSDQVPMNQARSTLVDWDGNLWVSALGLHRVLGWGQWQTYTTVHGLPALDVWGVLRDRHGRVWVGTGNGLSVGEGGGWRTLVARQSVSTIAEAPDGSLWVGGGEDASVLRIDSQTFAKERVPILPGAMGSFARGFAFRGDEVWVASLIHGTYAGKRVGRGWQWHKVVPPGGEHEQQVYLSQDRQGRIYLPNSARTHVREGDRWWVIPNRNQGVPYIAELGLDGDLWMGSYGTPQLERYRWTSGGPVHAEPLPVPQLRPGLHLYNLVVDGKGRFWLGTSQGLLRMEPGDPLATVRYTSSDGLPSQDCNRGGLAVAPEGEVWVGTSFGLGRLRELTGLPRPPLRAPVVSGIQLHDCVLPGLPAVRAFAPGHRTMVWHLSVPTFSLQDSLQYEMQLDDAQAWMPLPQPSLGFSGLAPGPHQVRLRARLPEGRVSPVAAIDFTLLPLWWERLWVRLAGAVLLLAGAAGGVLRRLRRVRLRNRWLEGVVAEHTADLRAANAQLQEARDLLERSARGRSAYIASLNHELRNPLSSILLYAEMMLDSAPDAASAQGAFRQIHEAGLKVQGLIGGILDLAKLEAGVVSPRIERVEAHLVCSDAGLQAGALLRNRGSRLEMACEPCSLVTDVSLLRRVLNSLLRLGAESVERGTLGLSARRDGDGLRVEVWDDGAPLSEQQLSLLFLDFAQDWTVRTIPWHPAALELTICRRFIELLGGSLEAETGPGIGKRFVLCLPLG